MKCFKLEREGRGEGEMLESASARRSPNADTYSC